MRYSEGREGGRWAGGSVRGITCEEIRGREFESEWD